MIQVRPFQGAADFERFAEFAHEVYRDNRFWAPPDRHHLLGVLAGETPECAHVQLRAFGVERDGRLAATLLAVVEPAYNRHWNERMGHLFFFEALPGRDEEVQALLQAVCQWLRGKGCESARTCFLPGWQLPLTIDAYDQIPTVFHTFNPPYYHGYIKNAGFMTEKGAVEYRVRFTAELAAAYHEMIGRAKSAGVVLRSWDFGRLDQETSLFTDVFNETFARHWGFFPLPLGVMAGFTVGLKDFLVPEFNVFAEVEGRPAGFVYSLPDLNQVVHPSLGRPPEEIDHGVLLIIGVKQDYRGRGVNLALAAQSYLAMIERGYKTASYTVVLDDNRPSRRTAEKLGARVARNFVIYRKNLA